MDHTMHTRRTFPASQTERASIRALKNWLLAAPSDSPFDDQLVRLRIAAAIAALSSASNEQAAVKAKAFGPAPSQT
jgi:hypothetical protein